MNFVVHCDTFKRITTHFGNFRQPSVSSEDAVTSLCIILPRPRQTRAAASLNNSPPCRPPSSSNTAPRPSKSASPAPMPRPSSPMPSCAPRATARRTAATRSRAAATTPRCTSACRSRRSRAPPAVACLVCSPRSLGIPRRLGRGEGRLGRCVLGRGPRGEHCAVFQHSPACC